jgi:hypothetical protein
VADDWKFFTGLILNIRMDELRAYVGASERAFEEAFRAFDDAVAAEAAKMTEEQRDDFYAWKTQEAFELSEKFPRLGRHLAFAATFAFFEHTLTNLCDQVQRHVGLTIGVRDMKGNGVDAAKNYLKKAAKVNVPTDTANWERLMIYGKIRNLIMHNESQVSGYRSANGSPTTAAREFESWVSKVGEIEVTIAGDFTLSTGVCLAAVDTVRAFLDELFPLLPPTSPDTAP